MREEELEPGRPGLKVGIQLRPPSTDPVKDWTARSYEKENNERAHRAKDDDIDCMGMLASGRISTGRGPFIDNLRPHSDHT